MRPAAHGICAVISVTSWAGLVVGWVGIASLVVAADRPKPTAVVSPGPTSEWTHVRRDVPGHVIVISYACCSNS
jgi:hypothetical protein